MVRQQQHPAAKVRKAQEGSRSKLHFSRDYEGQGVSLEQHFELARSSHHLVPGEVATPCSSLASLTIQVSQMGLSG